MVSILNGSLLLPESLKAPSLGPCYLFYVLMMLDWLSIILLLIFLLMISVFIPGRLIMRIVLDCKMTYHVCFSGLLSGSSI